MFSSFILSHPASHKMAECIQKLPAREAVTRWPYEGVVITLFICITLIILTIITMKVFRKDTKVQAPSPEEKRQQAIEDRKWEMCAKLLDKKLEYEKDHTTEKEGYNTYLSDLQKFIELYRPESLK